MVGPILCRPSLALRNLVLGSSGRYYHSIHQSFESILTLTRSQQNLDRYTRTFFRSRGAASAAIIASTKTQTTPTSLAQVWKHVKSRWIEYLSIPCVAAFVGITTNWMGVKMLFYPIEYVGIDYQRWPNTPYGLFGWQGVVPTKTQVMASRLVKIVTSQLLSLEEAFGRLHPATLSKLLLPAIQESIREDCGMAWATTLQPLLPILLPYLVQHLQKEIDDVMDLDQIVLQAFVRDKVVLVDLFQRVGRVELEFLVNSGFGFGFLLGLLQMITWARFPLPWTLPAAGAFVGYVTNWVAVKLLFEPAEPVNIGNLFVIQGLFESRQIEVSDEFGQFMNERVLNSYTLLQDLVQGDELYDFLRRHLPYPVPESILHAAVKGIAKVAHHPLEYPHIHQYVSQQLDIEKTLARQLKTLSPTEFENLLHPVFQEDEIILIATGGVLGLIAGALQTRLGWGGSNAKPFAITTIVATLSSSFALYIFQKFEASSDSPSVSEERPTFRKRETVLRTPLPTDPNPTPILKTVEKALEDTVVPTVRAVREQLPDVQGLIRRASTQRSGGNGDK